MTSSRQTLLTFAMAAAVMASLATAQTTRRSEAELTAAVSAKPADLAPYLELAQLYAASGRREKGEAVLREALTLHRDSGAVFAGLLSLFRMPADADKMLSLSEEWTRADSSNPKPLMMAVQMHLYKGTQVIDQPAEATTHYDRAMQWLDDLAGLMPDDPTIRAMRLGIAKQKAMLIENPEERARLLRELAQQMQEAATMGKSTGGQAWTDGVVRPPSAFPNAVRVGGNVRPPQKIKDVRPVMPPAARENRVQGVVILEVVLDEAGRVVEARTLRSIPLLDQAALEAVSQWEFTPTQIDGAAVPVIMTVTVQFTISEGP